MLDIFLSIPAPPSKRFRAYSLHVYVPSVCLPFRVYVSYLYVYPSVCVPSVCISVHVRFPRNYIPFTYMFFRVCPSVCMVFMCIPSPWVVRSISVFILCSIPSVLRVYISSVYMSTRCMSPPWVCSSVWMFLPCGCLLRAYATPVRMPSACMSPPRVCLLVCLLRVRLLRVPLLRIPLLRVDISSVWMSPPCVCHLRAYISSVYVSSVYMSLQCNVYVFPLSCSLCMSLCLMCIPAVSMSLRFKHVWVCPSVCTTLGVYVSSVTCELVSSSLHEYSCRLKVGLLPNRDKRLWAPNYQYSYNIMIFL